MSEKTSTIGNPDISFTLNNDPVNPSPQLNTTTIISLTGSSQSIYSIPTSSYTGAFYDYSVSGVGGVRVGTIIAAWNASNVEFTEVSTNDIGNTNNVTFSVGISGGNAILYSTSTSGTWTVKVMIRSI